MDFNEFLQNELKQEGKNDTDICHITFEKLNDDYIILDCKHTFNYDAIFKEVCIQKTVVNKKESHKLAKFCIKCPYCRFVQNGILPYRNKYKKIHTVNTPKCRAFLMKKFQCKYIFASGKKKKTTCGKFSEFKYCNQHHKIITKREEKLKKQINNETLIINEEPVNTINEEPVNEIVSLNVNLHIQTALPVKLNPKKNTIISNCSYVFTKGKHKGENCSKIIKTTENNPTTYKKIFCRIHSKHNTVINSLSNSLSNYLSNSVLISSK